MIRTEKNNKQSQSGTNSIAVSKSPFFQPKLAINKPGDQYEQEADTVADKVVRMQEPFIQPKPIAPVTIQRKCAHCEEEEKLQRKEVNDKETEAGEGLESYIKTLDNRGESLPRETRNYYEPRFGYNFDNIKVHTDSVAAKSADSINALAYTSGNNIVFNKGMYSPGTPGGKKLLAHELTHTIQKKASPSLIQRSCDLNFTGYTGTTCQGTIEVGATTISSPIIGYYHLFIVYTDSAGDKFYLRGGPGSAGAGGYGNIVVRCGTYREGDREYDSRNVLEEVYRGTDACSKLLIMQQRLNDIESWNVAYIPAGPNSNSVIATLLAAAGLPLRKPPLPTPGFDMQVTRTGTTPVAQDRPTRFVVSLGGGSGLLLDAELQQRLYTFSPVVGGGIPIPIPVDLDVGLYVFPDQNRIGGSVGLSTNISLINLPLSVFSPLGIVAGGGFTAGSVRSTDATGVSRTDPEIGGYARAGVYTDIGRLRISPFYQYNNLRDTQTGATTEGHSFVVQVGGTF